MALQKLASPFGRDRSRWIPVLVGLLSCMPLGCNPQALSMLAMGLSDNKVDPDYKIFAKDQEVTLVVLCNFAHPQLHPDLQPAEMELAEKVSTALRERCFANKHKLKLVPYAEVRSYQIKQWDNGNPSPVEVGKKFKADYVLDMTIQSLSLYEKRSRLYRGEAEVAVSLFKVDVKEGDHKVFYRPDYRRENSPNPIDPSGISPAAFRGFFMAKIARDISRMFIAYPTDERGPFEDRGSSLFDGR